jgi:hypothetical protein
LIVAVPVKVLLPVRVSVPVPFLVIPPPVEVALVRRAWEMVML